MYTYTTEDSILKRSNLSQTTNGLELLFFNFNELFYKSFIQTFYFLNTERFKDSNTKFNKNNFYKYNIVEIRKSETL